MKEITVRYKKKSTYCISCEQEIKNPKEVEREFIFTKDTCLNWLDEEYWKFYKEDEEGLTDMIDEFCYETISFFATSSYESISVESEDVEKLKQFVLSEVINP